MSDLTLPGEDGQAKGAISNTRMAIWTLVAGVGISARVSSIIGIVSTDP